jgi:Flp pilus assembly protein TadG
MFALALPAVLGAVGVAIDFATFTMKQQALQAAADTAALAGAKELGLASSNDSTIVASTQAYLTEALKGKDENAAGTVTIDRKKGNVKVLVSEQWTPFFAQFIGAQITPVVTSATASLAGETKICVLSLATKGPLGLSMLSKAHLEANGCGVYTNSTDANSIYLGDTSTISATILCSAGGIYNKGGSITGSVITDCPPIADPLATRASPAIGACDYTNTIVSTGTSTLKPGVYCGGLRVDGTAVVTFGPGTYIIKNGPFRVKDTASVTGKNVSFFLTGALGLISFTNDATVSLSGAETGSMAGLLFFDDPKASGIRIHNISASNAYTLTGTIYLPHAVLLVDPVAKVGEKSAYTAIIVDRLAVENGPNLVLNSDYGATSVPVPDGLASTSSVILSN